MRRARSLMERLWPKVNKTNACWEWNASTTAAGYGQINSGPRGGTMLLAHRVVYEALVGPIPVGMEIDHLCRNRACVNPDHLEPVTHAENVRRGDVGKVNAARQRAKTLCVNGHSLAGENLYVNPDGHRECRACRAAAVRRYQQRQSAESR